MNSAPVLSSTPIQARCFFHPDLDAIAACGRCGTFTCATCQQLASDGRSYCFRCLAAPAPLADRGTRFVANLIDGFATTFFLVVVVVAAVAMAEDETIGLAALVIAGALALGATAVQLYLQATCGQSIGKKLLRIKVVRMDGGPVSLGRLIFLRNVVPYVFNTLCNGVFGVADALFILGEQQRCLHDYLADTKVIRVDEAPRA